MSAALLVARLVLAGVLLLAGLAKLIDLDGARCALGEFGVTSRLTSAATALLVIAELGTAALLVPAATAWLGGVSALALTTIFTSVVVRALRSGRTPTCSCFGQLSARPISGRTLLRNTALLALALFIALAGRRDPGPEVLAMITSAARGISGAVMLSAVNIVLLAALGWLVLMLWRQHGRLLARVQELEARGGVLPPASPAFAAAAAGLPIGDVAPDFELSSLAGERLTSASLLATGRPVVLLFVDPACGPCNALLPAVAQWERDDADRFLVVVASRGTPDENRGKPEAHGLRRFLLQRGSEVSDRYRIRVVPSAIVIGPDGRIASRVASGADAIAATVRDLVGSPAPATATPFHAPETPAGK